MSEVMEGQWWMVVDKTSPLLVSEMMEEQWWMVVDVTSPLLMFEAMKVVVGF